MKSKSYSRCQRKQQKKQKSGNNKGSINNYKKMTCKVTCTYFPNMDCDSWKYDEDGIKRRNDGKKFICLFDGHEIKSWYDKCPLKEG